VISWHTCVAIFLTRPSLGCSVTCSVASDAACAVASDTASDVASDIILDAVFRLFAGWLLSSSAGSSLAPRYFQTSSADLIFASRFRKKGAAGPLMVSMSCVSLSTGMTIANGHTRGEISDSS